MNVERKEDYSQVCVWPGTIIPEKEIGDFAEWMETELGARVQYLEQIETNPDLEDGVIVEGTGGRNDAFFAVHKDDIPTFALPRLMLGIRWIEDVYFNNQGHLYPERVADYRTW